MKDKEKKAYITENQSIYGRPIIYSARQNMIFPF
jgi:hypothetical protein